MQALLGEKNPPFIFVTAITFPSIQGEAVYSSGRIYSQMGTELWGKEAGEGEQ